MDEDRGTDMAAGGVTPHHVSGGTPAPSEAGSSVCDYQSAHEVSSKKVSLWQKRSQPESSASSGYKTWSSVMKERKHESFEEEWSRRKEEVTKRMLKFVDDREKGGPVLSLWKRRDSLSGGTPALSEENRPVWDSRPAHEIYNEKVSWLLKRIKSKIEIKQEGFREEWSRRDEELTGGMLKTVVDSETEGSTLPFRKWRNSFEFLPPSLSGGSPAPSEAGSSVWNYQSAHEVSSRKGSQLQKRSNPQSSASSGYGTGSSVVSEAEKPDRVTLEEDSVGDTPN